MTVLSVWCCVLRAFLAAASASWMLASMKTSEEPL
jgi:hypothetical protein